MFEESDKSFESVIHVSTETSVIFTKLVYKALEVEFIVSKQMLIMINGDNACYVGETCQHFSTRVREHLVSDRASHVFKASARFCTLSRFVFSG